MYPHRRRGSPARRAGTIAESGGASHLAAAMCLASRCAGFVTIKFVRVAPGQWLLWPAWGAWAISALAIARELRSQIVHQRYRLVRRLGALLAVAWVIVVLQRCDQWFGDAVGELRHDYYYGHSKFQPCSRSGD